MLLEVETQRESGFLLPPGTETEAVRVRYRQAGARRWRSFLLVPDPGQTLDELEQHAGAAAGRAATGNIRRGRVVGAIGAEAST